jgi:hypothetical protein
LQIAAARFHEEATMTIEITLRADEASRTPDRGCRWTARAVLPDGRTFEAQARAGATHELARTLLAAGIADDLLEVRQAAPPLPGHLTYRGFHALAEYTLVESAASPLHRARWRDPSSLARKIDVAGIRNAQNRDEGRGAATPVAEKASPACFALPTRLLLEAAE